MKTTYYTTLLVMSCMIIGFTTAGIIFYKAHNIDESRNELQLTRYKKNIVHESNILTKQWLISLDLYLTGRQHYLFQGLDEQAKAIHYLHNSLSENPASLSVSKKVSLVIEKCKAVNSKPVSDERWQQLINETDILTADLIAPLKSYEKTIGKQINEFENNLKLHKKQFYQTIYICPALFIIFSLIMLRWAHRIIVHPVEALTAMTQSEKINDLHLNKTCPTEVKDLATSLKSYTQALTQAKEVALKEIKRTEYANMRLLNIMHTAVDAIVCTDKNGLIIQMNESFETLAEIVSKEAKNLNLNDFISKINLNDFGKDSLDLFVNVQETRLLTKSQKEIPIEMSISSFMNEYKLNFTIIIRDISGRLAIQNQLLQSQKLEAIGRLSAGIAHEINTPIQYIMDYHHFLKDACHDLLSFMQTVYLIDNKDLNAAAEDLDLDFILAEIPHAVEGSLHGLKEISEIVKSVKVMSHPAQSEKVIYNINKLIREALTISRNEWKCDAKIKYELNESLPNLLCFPGLLNQCLVNLIVNAAHAIHSKNIKNNCAELGFITLSTEMTKSHFIISVSDSGEGMSADVQEKIFDPFFTTKDIGVGTGQGLALVYDFIVTKHKGLIECKSEEMKGSSFTLKLPI